MNDIQASRKIVDSNIGGAGDENFAKGVQKSDRRDSEICGLAESRWLLNSN